MSQTPKFLRVHYLEITLFRTRTGWEDLTFYFGDPHSFDEVDDDSDVCVIQLGNDRSDYSDDVRRFHADVVAQRPASWISQRGTDKTVITASPPDRDSLVIFECKVDGIDDAPARQLSLQLSSRTLLAAWEDEFRKILFPPPPESDVPTTTTGKLRVALILCATAVAIYGIAYLGSG